MYSNLEVPDYFQKCTERATYHKRLYQYTTVESLKYIVQNRTLRLTRIDCVNDFEENKKINKLWKEKVFVSCFTHREEESPFFWYMYAKSPKEGVRISFSNTFMVFDTFFTDPECNSTPLVECKKTESDERYDPNMVLGTWGIYDHRMIDVDYVERNESIVDFLGRKKYKEWDLECETRLRVAVRPRALENALKGDKTVVRTPEQKYIYTPISPSCLSSMIITISPYAKAGLREEVEMILKEANLLDKVKIQESTLKGEISLESDTPTLKQ